MKNGRVPPQSLTSEKAVLGACLLNESAIFSAMEFVRAGDFYKKEHQAIFQAMLDLNSTGWAIPSTIPEPGTSGSGTSCGAWRR